MQTGTLVRKKSNKPFQNGEKMAVIESFTTMIIPLGGKREGTREAPAVTLVSCKGPAEFFKLREVN